MSKPLFLLAPASWFPSWSLEPLRAALTDLGYPTWCEDVPTQRGDPSKGVDDDVLFLRQAVENIIAAGQDVIVCGWSMSAWSAPAAVEGLTGRRTAGRGAVIGLVYMACVIPEKCPMDAQSIMDQYGGANGAWYSPEELAAVGMEYGPLVSIKNPAPIFFQGLPSTLSTATLAQQVVPVAAAAFGVYNYVPRDPSGNFLVPAMYVSAKDDHSVPTRVQDQVIAKEGKRFAKVVYLDGGHLVGMCHPDQLAEALVSFAGDLA